MSRLVVNESPQIRSSLVGRRLWSAQAWPSNGHRQLTFDRYSNGVNALTIGGRAEDAGEPINALFHRVVPAHMGGGVATELAQTGRGLPNSVSMCAGHLSDIAFVAEQASDPLRHNIGNARVASRDNGKAYGSSLQDGDRGAFAVSVRSGDGVLHEGAGLTHLSRDDVVRLRPEERDRVFNSERGREIAAHTEQHAVANQAQTSLGTFA